MKYNNAESTLAWDITASGTAIVLKTGEWDLFPSTGYPEKFKIEHFEGSVVTKREVLTVSWRTGDILTISDRASESCVQDESLATKTRTQDAYSFSSGDTISMTITEGDYNWINTELERLETDKLDKSTYDSEKPQKWSSTVWTDSYQATISTVSSYVNGQRFLIEVDVSNTWNATFEANALWAKAIKIWEGGVFIDIPSDTITAWGFMNLTYISSWDFFQYTDDPWNVTVSSSSSTQSDVTLWESVSIWESLYVSNWETTTDVDFEQISTNSSINYSVSSATKYFWQTWTAEWLFWTDVDVNDTSIRLQLHGGYWGQCSVVCKIWEDTTKTTLLWTSNQWITNLTSYTVLNLDFSSPVTLAIGTSYYFEYIINENYSWASRVKDVSKDTTNPYSWWVLYTWSTPVAESGSDLYFKVNYTTKSEEVWKSYLTDASNSDKINFFWYASESWILDDVIKINTDWVDNNQTFLEADIWKPVYLSDTPWEISTIPWTNSVQVWKILSTTEVEIDTFNNDNLNWESTTSATTGWVTLWNAEWYITIKINWVYKKIPYYWV